MCIPLAAAAIIASVAGSAAQAAGQRRAQKAQAGAREAERVRQKGFQDESAAAVTESMANASKGSQDTKQAQAEGERKSAYDAATEAAQAPVAAVGQNLAGDTAGNAVIGDELARQSSRATGYAGQQGSAKAAIQGFNDLQLGNALYNARQLQHQAQLGNFMQGSAGVLPVEMEAASHKGDGLKNFGSALSAAGTIMGMGAGSGWFSGANAAAPTVANTAANTITSSSLLPTANGLTAFDVNPDWFRLGNPNNPLFKTPTFR